MKERKHDQERLGDEERRLMHLVPAPFMRGRGREEPDNECVYETKGKTNDS